METGYGYRLEEMGGKSEFEDGGRHRFAAFLKCEILISGSRCSEYSLGLQIERDGSADFVAN